MQNILVVSLSPIVVKISDFGVSKQAYGTVLRTAVGTPSYTAPEIMGYLTSETSDYTNAVDIWSLGCLIHAILTMKTPFESIRKLVNYIDGQAPFPDTKLNEKHASSAVIRLITRLMSAQPQDRLTTEQALKDPWFTIDLGQEDTVWTKISAKVANVPKSGNPQPTFLFKWN